MIAAADACYANDWGCSVHQLGLRELITEARRTDASALPRRHSLARTF